MDSLVPRDEYVALRHCVYLNQAALGLIPATSVSAMVRFLADVAQLGNLRLSDDAEVVVLDDVRRAAAQLLDVPPGWVAITGGASEALGQVAALIAEIEGSVLLVSSDFPSVTYPWLVAAQRHGTAIKTVDDCADTNLTDSLIDAIDESTKVVCFGAVQYATGSQVDVAAVAERAHRVGARVVVDATQLAGAGPVSVRQWGADAVVCSGYKWLSSHGGVAVLTLAPDLVERTPQLVGWKGTRQPFAFEPLSLPLAADARRFELSTIAYVSAIGLRESIAILSALDPLRIEQHAHRLAAELVERVAPLGWTPFRPLTDPAASSHIVALSHPTMRADDVQRGLAHDHNVICSSRNGSIRVSLHVYNDDHDLAALVGGLHRLAPVT
jgi:cysteine desulfurase / selenocysteine lyase